MESMSSFPVCLGIDLGMVRCGLAINQEWLAVPLEIVQRKELVERVCEVVAERSINTIVLGKPDGVMEKEAETVKKELEERLSHKHVRCVFEDETGSTLQADAYSMNASSSQMKRRKPKDHHSAAIILQNWLDVQSQ